MKYLFALFCFVGLVSCDKNDTQPSDPAAKELIFGSFYGECFGERCVEIFKITDSNLYEDVNDAYVSSSGFADTQFEESSADKFLIADGLIDLFPTELLQESEKVFGQPDAGDWGGFYVEYKFGDIHDFWILDTQTNSIPAYALEFHKELGERILLLSD